MITFSIIWLVCGLIAAFIMARDLYKFTEAFRIKDIGLSLIMVLLGGLGLWIAVCIVYQKELEEFGNKKLF